MKNKPPKRRIIKNGINLNEEANKQFNDYVKTNNFFDSILSFIKRTDLYLRGRCGNTEPCGYVFISQDSFEKGHASLLFIDPMPTRTLLNISFRKWKRILPFSIKEWNSLDPDRAQKDMKIIELSPKIKLDRAIYLSKLARENFSNEFDLSIDLLK